jgi:hypothetical protein
VSEVRIVSGSPNDLEARVIERAFAVIDAEARADAANAQRATGNPWTMSGRVQAHQAAGLLIRGREAPGQDHAG